MHASVSVPGFAGSGRARAWLTRQVGESGLAADEGGRSHGGRLCCAGAEAGAQGGSCAEESGSHRDVCDAAKGDVVSSVFCNGEDVRINQLVEIFND